MAYGGAQIQTFLIPQFMSIIQQCRGMRDNRSMQKVMAGFQ